MGVLLQRARVTREACERTSRFRLVQPGPKVSIRSLTGGPSVVAVSRPESAQAPVPSPGAARLRWKSGPDRAESLLTRDDRQSFPPFLASSQMIAVHHPRARATSCHSSPPPSVLNRCRQGPVRKKSERLRTASPSAVWDVRGLSPEAPHLDVLERPCCAAPRLRALGRRRQSREGHLGPKPGLAAPPPSSLFGRGEGVLTRTTPTA